MVFTWRVNAQPGTASALDGALVSGEAVELDVRIASVGSRVVGLLVDVVVQGGILLVALPLALTAIEVWVPFADYALVQAVSIVTVVVVLVGYPTIFETLSGGRTLGKMTLGLRVVRDDGGPIRFRHALTRSLVGVAVEWPGVVLPLFTWIASLTVMLAHPRGKRIGDLAAGTVVIHERTPAAWGWVPGMPPALAGWAATLDLTALTDDLALAVRHFLARGHALAEPERSRLGQALAAEVAATTTPPAPPGVPGWAYLAAVLAERHRRAAQRLARARAVTGRLWPELSWPMGPLRSVPRPAATSAPTGSAGAPIAWATLGTPPAAASTQAWPSHTWPEPPWRTPAEGEDAHDWTGLRPPRVASALRSAAPPADA
jgi:uncharacterized RDD family membrane protein YckC